MTRTVPEWIGKTADSKCPPKVRQRILERDKYICHECGTKIQTGDEWQADHRPALINGGENRESMMFPVHVHCHKIRTAKDVAEKAKVAAMKGKHTGAIRPKQSIRSAPFPKTEKPGRVEKQKLAPRPLFRSADHG